MMENFVARVMSLSGGGNFQEVVEFLQKASDTLGRSSPTVLSNVLDTLDIQHYSLGVLAVLKARLQQTNIGDWDDLFRRIAFFVLECNGEQIRYWAKGFGNLCHLFTDQLVQRNSAIAGIPVLLKAIAKIQLSETSLTSVHADVCRLCLAAKCFSPALNHVLNVDYVDVAREAAAEPGYILLFFHYGGMIFAALKMYDMALYYLEACVTLPAVVVSHVMLEAYKKYLLVSLIANGDRPKDSSGVLPKHTSPVVNKYIKPLCAPYQELVTAYHSNKTNELERVINKHSDVFDGDGNAGLVRQTVASQTKSNIKRLTKTFVTLSLEDVAARVGLGSSADAERMVVAMIEEGSIHARISQKDGMVQFDANPERFDNVGTLSELENSIAACIALNDRVARMEEDILLNPSFVKKSAAAAVGSSSSSSSAAHGGSNVPATPGASRSATAADLDDDFFVGNFGTSGRGGTSSGPSSSSAVANHVGAPASNGPATAAATADRR